MADRVAEIETIVTQTEVEALHLEQNLIKRHRPPYNVRLRDDKSFPYIAVTVEDDYPRVMFTRERHRRGVVYFGPYANAKKVRETLDVLNRVFRYRPCEGPQPGRRSGIPCLDYHIERCFAPCVGYISKDDYRELIDQVIEFLSGDDRPIRRTLERQMREAAAEERFEDAARYRNRLARDRTAARAAGGRAPLDRDDRRDRDRGVAGARGGAGVPAARRPDGRPLLVPPGERGRRRARRRARELLPRVLRSGAVDPAPDSRAAGERRHLRAGRVPLGPARLPRRGARARARREAPAAGAGAAERTAGARLGDVRQRDQARTSRRGARRAARGAQPRVAADPDRVLRHLEHPGPGDRRLDGRVRGRRREEGALPQVPGARPGRPGRLRRDAGGRSCAGSRGSSADPARPSGTSRSRSRRTSSSSTAGRGSCRPRSRRWPSSTCRGWR